VAQLLTSRIILFEGLIYELFSRNRGEACAKGVIKQLQTCPPQEDAAC